jgi:AcrR family transcriptional regulator
MDPEDARLLTDGSGPRWRRLDRDERRAQILVCARTLFTEHGFADVSMERIATCAGVRRGLLHHYFGNKHDLYVEVIRDLLQGFGELLDESDGADADGAGGDAADLGRPDLGRPDLEPLVASQVRRWLDIVEANAAVWLALVDAEGVARDPEVVGLRERARGAMVEGVITKIGIPVEGPHVRAVLRTYSGLADVATREWLLRETLDRPQVEALLTTTLVALMRDVLPAVGAARAPSRTVAETPRRTRKATR